MNYAKRKSVCKNILVLVLLALYLSVTFGHSAVYLAHHLSHLIAFVASLNDHHQEIVQRHSSFHHHHGARHEGGHQHGSILGLALQSVSQNQDSSSKLHELMILELRLQEHLRPEAVISCLAEPDGANRKLPQSSALANFLAPPATPPPELPPA